jgi:dCMP deaminase
MARPSFNEIYMQLATSLANRSTCKRLAVGCVISSEDYRQIYGVGYNGGASGLHDECTAEEGKCGCAHGEVNSAINCSAPRQVSKLVFVTTAPCLMCSKILVNLGGVKKVYYNQDYRNNDGLKLLSDARIQIEKLNV